MSKPKLVDDLQLHKKRMSIITETIVSNVPELEMKQIMDNIEYKAANYGTTEQQESQAPVSIMFSVSSDIRYMYCLILRFMFYVSYGFKSVIETVICADLNRMKCTFSW